MDHLMKSLWMWAVFFLAPLGAEESMPEMSLQAEASVRAYAPGHPFLVALHGKTTPGWHAYYRNPGTVGMGMELRLAAPAGFEVQGPYWQTPQRIVGAVGTAYGYESPVVVWRMIPQADAPQDAKIELSATAQLCSDTGCMPPVQVATALSLSKGEPEPNDAWSSPEKFVEVLGDEKVQDASASHSSGGVVLRFHDPGFAGDPIFISDDNSIHPALKQQVQREDGMLIMQLPTNSGEDVMYPAPSTRPRSLDGHLAWPGGQHASISVPLQSSSRGVPAGFWGIALGLFLGGVLLNLMPCVFPVLGLKVMGFVQLSGGGRGHVVAHSLAFVAGIVTSFLVLGFALVVVSNLPLLAQSAWQDWLSLLIGDEGGADRSWAAWMQNEWVVYGLMVLLLVLGLGMYGVFEIGVGATAMGQGVQNRRGVAGAFLQGLLVTLVATPCSAPFLGAAMPAAMALPGVWLLAALVIMGLGLGLPYLALSLFPGLVDLLPRPGAWMESLKQGLSFLMIAAAAWLLDVYWSTQNSARGLSVLVGLVAVCAAGWVYGRWCPMYRSRVSRVAGLLVAVVLALAGVWCSMPRQTADTSGEVTWEEWSPGAVQKALEDGDPVYVDFTAKWCLTCQANKGIAYTDEVLRLMEERGVTLMRADKTKPDPKIDEELRRLGRSSVPVNALYVPGKEPVVTRELLSPGYLIDFLRQHLPAAEQGD